MTLTTVASTGTSPSTTSQRTTTAASTSSSSSQLSTTVGTGATVGTTTTLSTSSSGSTTTTRPTIPTPPPTTTSNLPTTTTTTTSTKSTTTGTSTEQTTTTAGTGSSTGATEEGTTTLKTTTKGSTTTKATIPSRPSTTEAPTTSATQETTSGVQSTTSTQSSTVTTKPTTSVVTTTASSPTTGSTSSITSTTSGTSTPSETTSSVSTTSVPTTTSVSTSSTTSATSGSSTPTETTSSVSSTPSTTSSTTVTGTPPTNPPTTPCAHTSIEMRENLQNIKVTIVGESQRYAGSAVTGTLALEDDIKETVIADIIETKDLDNPVFVISFTVSNVIRAEVELQTTAGITSGVPQAQDLQGLSDEPVTVDFNGAVGSKIIITLFKATYTSEKMQISKLKIEACFESTACDLITVTNDNAEDFASVTDINGNAVGQIFTSGDLTSVPRSTNGNIVLTLHLNGATLFSVPVTHEAASFKLMYMEFPIFDSATNPSSNPDMDLHFDGIFKDMDTLKIVITPTGNQPMFRINGFLGCMERIETTTATTTTTTTTVQTTSASGSTVSYPTGTSSTTPPTTTTPCVHTSVEMGQNEQNVEIEIVGEPTKYAKKAVTETLQLESDSNETVIIKLAETSEKDNPMFSLSFKTSNILSVVVVLKTSSGVVVGEPQTENLQGNNDDVVFEFNGAYGHLFEITVTKASYATGKMQISEVKITACFESTACIITPTVTNNNYEEYVSVTDTEGDAANSVFTSGDLTGVARMSDGNIPLVFNFNKATLYSVTLTVFAESLDVLYGIIQYKIPVGNKEVTMTLHFDGIVKDMDTLTIVVKPGAGENNPTLKINEIEGCMGTRETTTVLSTTPVETTTSATTTISIPSEETKEYSTSYHSTTSETTTSGTTSTVPSVTTPSTTTLTTATSSLPTTTITIIPTTTTTTKMTSSATTTISTTTTVGVGQCKVSAVSLQSQISLDYYEDGNEPVGYYLDNGVQVQVTPEDFISEGEVVHFYCQNCTCGAVGQWVCNDRAEPCSCSYFTWSEWTNCNKDCGSGTRSRSKQLIPGLYNCEDEKTEVDSCFVKPCVTTTTEQPWSTWTPCNAADCEAGTQTRTRCESTDARCQEERACSKENNTNCECEDGKEFKSVCDYACNNTCKAYRTAECDESEDCENMACICAEGTTEHNGQCVEFKNCPCFDEDGTPMIQNTTKKYHDTCKECTCTEYGMDCKPLEECCIRDPWSDWSECYNNRMCGEGTRSRHSKVRYGSGPQCQDDENVESCVLPTPCGQCVYGGKVYNDSDIVEEHSDLCVKKICTNGTVIDETIQGVNGGFSEWLSWGACSATPMHCTGMRERRRFCNNPTPKCGDPCDGDFTDTEECNSSTCCEVTQWSTWNDCSSDCGGGTKERTRNLLQPSDAAYCSQALNETQACNTQSCETNCTTGDWTEWTPCSVTCGPGTKSRTREITSDIKEDCPHLNETEYCYPQDCVCDNVHETWTNNSGCEKSCENRYAPSQCNGPPACECEVSFVRNDDGVCVKEHECNKCKLANDTTVEEGAVFPNPLDKCSECRCEAGTIVCDSKCKQDVQCYEGEIKVLDEDGCCFVCKKDTCQLKPETKVLSDFSFKGYINCTTKNEVTYNYCSGGCGDSSHYPDGLGIPKTCKCCTSRATEPKDIEFECIDPAYPTGVVMEKMTIQEPTSCTCDITPCQPPS